MAEQDGQAENRVAGRSGPACARMMKIGVKKGKGKDLTIAGRFLIECFTS